MKIQNHRLIADDGTPVRYVETPNKSGLMTPEYLVMHYTAGSSAEGSVSWMCNPAAKAAAHLVIGRDGSLTQALFKRVNVGNACFAADHHAGEIGQCVAQFADHRRVVEALEVRRADITLAA